MNIVVYGAGAMGSLFGAILSRKNNVVLIGRKSHVETINKNGLIIKGKTNIKKKVLSFENIKKVSSPDLMIISVKSYDTEKTMIQAKKIISKKTVVISLQNGLDNIEKIEKYVSRDRIAVCITTHGAIFSKPGVIIHTGFGKTIVGHPNGEDTNKLFDIVKDFNESGIKTTVSEDIICEMWIKGIINSSINTLTAIFNCKNGYLLENPILEKLVEKICKESTDIAYSYGLDLDYNEMIMKTKEVIYDTNENFSSMLQSYKKGKKTEIDSINGVILKIGKKNNLNVFLNDFLVNLINSI